MVYRLISNLWEEKMDDFAVTMMNMIDRVGYKIGETGLLTYPDYVIWKGFETDIDIQRIRAGLKYNKCVVKTRNIHEEIDKSIARNETLQEYQYNTKLL